MDSDVFVQSGFVNIPAHIFVQNGLVVSVDTVKQIPESSADAPYFLIASALTSADVDDIVYTFVKSPQDFISSSAVVLSFFDGTEWRKPPFLSIKGILEEIDQQNLDYGRVGPVSGLLTTEGVTTYDTSAGVIVDRQGLRQTLEGVFSTPIISDDPDFNRVDRIIYRRPTDSSVRSGRREFVLGGAYAASVTPVHSTSFATGSVPLTKTKVLIGSDNAAHIFYISGYGNVFSVMYTKYTSSRTVQSVAPVALKSSMTTSDFDVCLDPSNNIYLATVNSSSDLVINKFSSVGVAIGSTFTMFTHGSYIAMKPSISYGTLNSSSTGVIFAAFQVQQAVNVNKIYFATASTSLAVATAAFQIAQVASDNRNPNLFVTDESIVYIAYEDYSTGKIYYSVHNDIGTVTAAALRVSGATNRIGFGTLVDVGTQPKVFVTDNKKVFVTFLQDKGGATYGLAVYTDGSAFMRSLVSNSEAILSYSLDFDNVLNGLHIITAQAARVDYTKLEGQTVQFTYQVSNSGTQGVSTVRDALGAMLHVWSAASAGTYTTFDTNNTVDGIGATTVSGSENNIPLTSSQIMIAAALLPTAPKPGDRITISGAVSGSNNVAKIVTLVETVSNNAPNDRYRITLDSPYIGTAESGNATTKAAVAAPDGNIASFVKTNSETLVGAFRYDVLASDILLARIALPGPVILNYSSNAVGPVPSETSKLIVFGTGTTFDWENSVAGALVLSSGLKILDLVNNIVYTVAAGTYPLADNEALYVTLDTVNLSVTPAVANVNSLPFENPIQVLGVIKQTQFVSHALLSSIGLSELDSGEVQTIGGDLPDLLRQRLGITSDTTFQAYLNSYIISLTDNYPTAISKLDAAVYAIQQDVPVVEVIDVVSPTSLIVAPILTWDASNTSLDIEVFVNGKFQVQDITGTTLRDYKKTDPNKLTFNGTIPAGSQVVIRKERTGGGAAGFLLGKEAGSQVIPVAQSINFLGAGVSTANGGGGQWNVTINGGPAVSTRIGSQYKNQTGATIAAGKILAFEDDGSVALADANVMTLSDFAGVTHTAITDLNFGDVVGLGRCPGILSGLGATPGDLVYLGETPGELTLTPPSGLTDTIFIVGRAVPASGAAPDGSAPDLFISPQIVG